MAAVSPTASTILVSLHITSKAVVVGWPEAARVAGRLPMAQWLADVSLVGVHEAMALERSGEGAAFTFRRPVGAAAVGGYRLKRRPLAVQPRLGRVREGRRAQRRVGLRRVHVADGEAVAGGIGGQPLDHRWGQLPDRRAGAAAGGDRGQGTAGAVRPAVLHVGDLIARYTVTDIVRERSR